MPVFMVERYIPDLGPEDVRAQAGRDASLASVVLRHLRTTYSREDELCFSFFEAPSLAELKAAIDAALVRYERITEVVDVTGHPDGGAANGPHTPAPTVLSDEVRTN